jgi:hypothetical protein
MNKSGDFAVCNSYPKDWGGAFLSWAIRFFGGAKLTHTLAYLGEETNGDRTDGLVFEADLLVKRTSVEDTSVVTWFHWKDPMIQSVAAEAIWQIRKEHDGELYGMTQLPWFIWLWIVEKLHLPARLAIHNVFHSGDICTGIVFLFLERIVTLLGIRGISIGVLDKIIHADGRDYRSQRPIDIQNIGLALAKADYVTVEEKK